MQQNGQAGTVHHQERRQGRELIIFERDLIHRAGMRPDRHVVPASHSDVETLFDRFALGRQATGTLLILGAAGGVGSILVQLARTLTNLTVIGTASRPDSQAWVSGLGAHHVVDHHGDLTANVRVAAPEGVDYVFTPHSRGNVDAFAALLRPGGHVTAIDEPDALDLLPLKAKSLSWHWEFMFTRPLFAPADPAHHVLLDDVARLVRSTQPDLLLLQECTEDKAALPSLVGVCTLSLT